MRNKFPVIAVLNLILLIAICIYIATTSTPNINYQEKYDSLQRRIEQAEQERFDISRRIDSLSSINEVAIKRVDSLSFVIKNYKNPYREKTANELGNLMDYRARQAN